MELGRDSKLVLSMVQNNTRAYFRLSVLNFTRLKDKHIIAQKLNCIDIAPFFLAERLTQSLPAIAFKLKRYSVLKNVITHQGFIKIEDVMKPTSLIIVYIKQKCVYQPQKTYSLFIELYTPQMKLLRTILACEKFVLRSDKLVTNINVVFNSENLNEIEVDAAASH